MSVISLVSCDDSVLFQRTHNSFAFSVALLVMALSPERIWRSSALGMAHINSVPLCVGLLSFLREKLVLRSFFCATHLRRGMSGLKSTVTYTMPAVRPM